MMFKQKDNEKNNSASAFEEIYLSYYHKIRSFCRNYLRDDDLSKSVAQEVFVAVWNNRENLNFSDELLPYLFILAKNRCLNILKRDKVQHCYSEYGFNYNRESLNYDSLKDSTINVLYGNEVEHLLNEALLKMPETVRSTFCQSRFRNLTYEEIAGIQNISIKTVEYRIMYALRVLRKILKDYLPILLGYLSAELF
ncbi:MAG: RNA polymerase sigma-70 factor [Bacteroidales bacterium]